MAVAVAPRQGEVWLANLDPAIGHEQAGRRPVVIISVDELNRSRAELVLAIPLTTTERAQRLHWMIDAPEGGLHRRSFAMPEMTRAISHRRLVQRFREVGSATLAELCRRVHLITRPPAHRG
ncbi:MAG: type II toxin-antitoxin system PemK/MazF family toxin [Solirubrobacteraceae bacterium]